ncbi:MAG: penicillin-binding protein 2 [Bacteroidia bacterium]|nr:penicillin-binding protein 2 [Bacteroidia bacterium]
MRELRERRTKIVAVIGAVCLLYGLRLFYLQVISEDFAKRAELNVVKEHVILPSRGVIYDRAMRIMVTNTPIFDLLITPNELYIPDTTIFERYLRLDRATIRTRIAQAFKYSRHKPSFLEKQIAPDVFYALQEHLWKCRGITVVSRISREYLYPVGAHFLGYIGEVSKKDVERSQGYYRPGDLIGTSGLERAYEELLRGRKGVEKVKVDVHGKEVGRYADGRYDTLAVKGEDIVITIDAELQRFGESLMRNKIGSIVAIEPATGEILAFVSAPAYDPNLMSGMSFAENWRKLYSDSLKPLFNRPLMATYPPGSIFKILNALVALNEGTLHRETYYGCGGGFMRNKGRPACHPHPSPLNLTGAIQHSCNAYFAAVYVDMLHHPKYDNFFQAYERWVEYMHRFGVGTPTGVDLPHEKKGRIPSKSFYDKWYGSGRWRAMTIVSNSIGQGEIEMTPLQMANVVCVIANKGYFVRPHFFKRLYNASEPAKYEKVESGVDSTHFNLVIDAMEQVVAAGTGYLAQIPGISVCGKTGTAENPHGEDHSVFFGFAPKQNPKIVVAVVVENAGWGGVWAAPMASLMMEKYLTGTVADSARYRRIIEADFVTPAHLRRGALPVIAAQSRTLDPSDAPAPPPRFVPPDEE